MVRTASGAPGGQYYILASDGSGLSANNRVTPRALVKLLGYVRRTPEMAMVRENLPVSDRDADYPAVP